MDKKSSEYLVLVVLKNGMQFMGLAPPRSPLRRPLCPVSGHGKLLRPIFTGSMVHGESVGIVASHLAAGFTKKRLESIRVPFADVLYHCEVDTIIGKKQYKIATDDSVGIFHTIAEFERTEAEAASKTASGVAASPQPDVDAQEALFRMETPSKIPS